MKRMANIAKGTQPKYIGTVQKFENGEWKDVSKIALWDVGNVLYYLVGTEQREGDDCKYHISLRENPRYTESQA